MKKLLLMLCLCSGLLFGARADASGSNTVFFPVRDEDFLITSVFKDLVFENEFLYNYLEAAESQIWVAKVSPFMYRTTYFYNAWGYDVELDFENFEKVNFSYYAALQAIIGVTSKQELVILMPTTASRLYPFSDFLAPY